MGIRSVFRILTISIGLLSIQARAQVITSLTARAVSSSQIDLSWPAAAGSIQSYLVYRNGVLIATVPATQASYQDSTLAASTSFSYQVSALSASVSATTLAPPPVPGTWQNTSMASQAGVFTAQFDAVPSVSTGDMVFGLSRVATSAYSDLATVIRFGVNSRIDVRNGNAYAALATVSTVAGRSYRIRMSVDIPNKRYSVWVTPQGQAEVLLAQNYAFRSEQASVASLSNRAKIGSPGDLAISNFSISVPPPPPAASCTFNGQTIASGNSVTAYQASSVPAGQSCTSQTRMCTNGTLSGSFSFASCSVQPPVQAGDGSANAPAGPPQLPNLLNGFVQRPSFNVAGVHYAVGIPAGLALKSPTLISMAGVSVNASSRLISITGSNVTLDGYDFSNWTVQTDAANTRIVRSKFFVGPVVGLQNSSNLYVGYCIIDGNNGQGSAWGGLISNRGRGMTIEYSWLKNAAGDLIQQVDGGNSIVIRYNLLQQAGMGAGAHGDYTQLAGGPFTLSMVGNTAVQSGGTTQGLVTEYVLSGEIANNVMVGGMSYATAVDISSIGTTVTVRDNYFGNLGYGFVYPNSGPGDGSPKTIFTNNVNMVTGAKIQD